MKLLRVIANMMPSSGGPCQGIRNVIPELEKLGVQNEVVSLDEPTAAYLRSDPFPVHALGAGKGPWCYNARLVPWLMANLQRFDAVIVHGLWLYPSYAVHKAMQQLKGVKKAKGKNSKLPKLFIMPHGMLDPYFQRSQERKIKAMRNLIYWKLIEGRVIREADGILFTCETEMLLAREPFQPYEPQHEINVGYGVAQPALLTEAMQEAFQQKCPGLNGKPYLLFLSRIHEKKGVDLLIQAYAAFVRTRAATERDLPRLVIAGPGLESPFGEKVQQMVAKVYQLNDLVFFPGMLSGDAKWGAFWGCEAFVLPSHQENFGIAVVEAMACGKPVLISNQVNIWPEIEGAGAGLVAPDSPEGTLQLLNAWANKTAVEKLLTGQKAKACYEKNFNVAPAAKHFLSAIMPLISPGSGNKAAQANRYHDNSLS